MMVKRVGAVVALAAAQGVVLIGTASAESGSVRVERDRLIVHAASGQDNRVTVTERDGRLWVSDVVPLTAGAGCVRATATLVSCASSAIASVTISTADGDDHVRADVLNIPTGTYLGDGNDTFTGGSGSDTVFGGSGDDVLNGGDEMFGGDFLYGDDGFDTINGGKGEDLMDGGPKNDVIDGFDAQMRDAVDYSKRNTSVAVDLTAGAGGETADNEADTILNVREVHGGSGDDKLTGNSLNNSLIGYDGADKIYGLDGNDELGGGPKKDHLDGGNHADTCNGGLPNEGDTLVNCNP